MSMTPLKVVVSGASGLIGRALCERLSARGDVVQRLVRGAAKGSDVCWNPMNGLLDAGTLEGTDVVVHLAGEPIAEGRWNAAKKRRIMESRDRGTRLIAETIAGMKRPPRAMLSASAIGIYGSRGDEVLSESSALGTGFLADVCRGWEAATEPAARAGIRVVHLRIGLVLDPSGGALKPMLPVFKMGLGGRLGSGRQWMSWITLADTIGSIEHVMKREDVSGPVNVVGPSPVTNADFTRALGRALGRTAVLPVPEWVLRLVIGEMADEAVLASARAMPTRLRESGFSYADDALEAALAGMLNRSRSTAPSCA